MGVAERREREKEQLRARIVEAASAIVSEQGLDALSMRSIAERIEYSPATIYLYFRDKDELIRSVVEEGARRFEAAITAELETVGPAASAKEQHAATGRAYALFALENPAYFRIMFELPTEASLTCLAADPESRPFERGSAWDAVVETVQRAIDAGQFQLPDATRGALIGWGLVHGLTSLCLSGYLSGDVTSRGDFLDLIEEAIASLYRGWEGVSNAACCPVLPVGEGHAVESGAGTPVGETGAGPEA